LVGQLEAITLCFTEILFSFLDVTRAVESYSSVAEVALKGAVAPDFWGLFWPA